MSVTFQTPTLLAFILVTSKSITEAASIGKKQLHIKGSYSWPIFYRVIWSVPWKNDLNTYKEECEALKMIATPGRT